MSTRHPRRLRPNRARAIFSAVVAGFLTAALISHAAAQSAPDNSVANVLVVGRVSSDPVKTLPRLQVLADYLVANLVGWGINSGRAIVARDNAEMADMLRRGHVHVLSETAMSALWFAEHAGAHPLLREHKGGVSSYRSFFITSVESPVQSIEDLRGHIVAFEDPGSTTGFLVPLAMLRAAGIPVRRIARGTRPAADEVGYIFTDSEIGVAAMVDRGLAGAGAVSDVDWQEFADKPRLRDGLRVFAASPTLTRSLLLAGPAVSAELRDQIVRVLAAAHEDTAADEFLQTYYRVSRYDPLVGSTARQLDIARELFPLVDGTM